MSGRGSASEQQALLTPRQSFYNAIGIDLPDATNDATKPGDPKQKSPSRRSFYKTVREEYKWQNVYYKTIKWFSIILLVLQIALGATITALASLPNPSKGVSVSLITLSAINTVLVGVLGFIRSQGEPARARQYRGALAKVKNAIDAEAGRFEFAEYNQDALTRFNSLQDMYDQARLNAEANYPDLWVDYSRSPILKDTEDSTTKPKPKDALKPKNKGAPKEPRDKKSELKEDDPNRESRVPSIRGGLDPHDRVPPVPEPPRESPPHETETHGSPPRHDNGRDEAENHETGSGEPVVPAAADGAHNSR